MKKNQSGRCFGVLAGKFSVPEFCCARVPFRFVSAKNQKRVSAKKRSGAWSRANGMCIWKKWGNLRQRSQQEDDKEHDYF